MTFEIEHFREDFHIGHVNTPVDFTQKASRRVFERGVGWKCVWPKVPPNFQVSHHIPKQMWAFQATGLSSQKNLGVTSEGPS